MSRTGSAQARSRHPTAASADKLISLWKAKRWYDADARGPLILQKTRDGWTADFIGHHHPVTDDGKQLTFALPDGDGDFIGHVPAGDGAIEGTVSATGEAAPDQAWAQALASLSLDIDATGFPAA
jgi:hypothetical protein